MSTDEQVSNSDKNPDQKGPSPEILLPASAPQIHGLAATPTADAEWVRLKSDLSLCLADLVEDDYLVLSHKRANYYVQFAAQGQFGMLAEAASNIYLPEEARLTPDDYVTMAELGWRIPTDVIQESGRQILDLTGNLPRILTEDPDTFRDLDGSPNFFLNISHPVDFAALAEFTVCTFREVYRVRHPGMLEYKAFNRKDVQIRFPTLRLKRKET
jgi:hypothetical protein